MVWVRQNGGGWRAAGRQRADERTTGIAARLALLLAGALLVVGMRAAAGAGVGPMSVQALAGPELLSDAHLRGFID